MKTKRSSVQFRVYTVRGRHYWKLTSERIGEMVRGSGSFKTVEDAKLHARAVMKGLQNIRPAL